MKLYKLEVMPEPSTEYCGDIIVKYIGNPTIELIGDASKFSGNGEVQNYYIDDDKLALMTGIVGSGTIYYNDFFTSSYNSLKVTITQTRGTNINYAGMRLGLSKGGADLYQSPSWVSIGTGNTKIETVDLTSIDASSIYLSFFINVVSGNTTYFDITSIIAELPYTTNSYYKCIEVEPNKFIWEDVTSTLKVFTKDNLVYLLNELTTKLQINHIGE